MKTLFLSLVVFFFLSCNTNPQYVGTSVYSQPITPQQNYEVLQQGGQQVVYVRNGAEEFFMDYLMFNSLMNSGGWGSVYGRYHSNPGYYYNPGMVSRYNSYTHVRSYNYVNGRSVSNNNSYYKNRIATNSQINNRPSVNTYRSPSRASISTSSSSPYRSPSRSSYSSPSRSSSSSSSSSRSSYKRR